MVYIKLFYFRMHLENIVKLNICENLLVQNFKIIESQLKEIHAKISNMQKDSQVIKLRCLEYQSQRQSFKKQGQKQKQIIKSHSKWIEHLSSELGQLGIQKIPIVSQQKIQQNDVEQQNKDNIHQIGQHHNIYHPNQQNNRTQKRTKTKKITFKNNQHNKNIQCISNNKGQGIKQLRQRILNLQQLNQIKNKEIQELSILIKGKKKNKDKDKHPQSKIHLDTNRSSKIQNQKQKQNYDDLFVDQNNDNEDLSTIQILKKNINELKQYVVPYFKKIQTKIKNNESQLNFIQKQIKRIDKASQGIKNDFAKTSSSLLKTRNNFSRETNDPKKDESLNDTRITNIEYYEQKLSEIFSQINYLHSQYLNIQNILAGERQDQSFNKQKTTNKSFDDHIVSNNNNMIAYDLKKLREQFNEFAYGIITGRGQTKTVVIKPNENKEDWKSLSTKINKLRLDLSRQVRQIQEKVVINNEKGIMIDEISITLQTLKLQINKKAENIDLQKGLKRIQTRLSNFITHVYHNDNKEKQNQALLAKHPWFCLSCDHEIKNYTGKIQKGSLYQNFSGKKVNNENHMVRRYDSKLPLVK